VDGKLHSLSSVVLLPSVLSLGYAVGGATALNVNAAVMKTNR